ncbi:hypothetical protein, partial [Micromonospora phaseoli]
MPPFGSGDLLHLSASPQFSRPMVLRLIRILPRTTYDGWLWVEGYQLNAAGDAVERRELFVRVAGVRQLPAILPAAVKPARRAAARRSGRAGAGDRSHP